MIVKFDDDAIVASVNTWTGYPKVCDITDETFKRMFDLLEFVEKSEHNVMPSSAFYLQKRLMSEGSFNSRGGHAFMFWFNNLDSANEFIKLYDGDLQVPPRLPSR